jgi:peptidoglycan/LPS O-acetylase OafA/YrhL
MRTEFSTYLDAVRFSAAIAVVAAHFTFPQFTAGAAYQGGLGDLAVSIFFVLSGYVIVYVADQKEHNLKDFAVSRLARVYSVAIPALILTLCVDVYLIHHGAADRFHIPVYEYQKLWKYLPVFLFFGSELIGTHVPVLGDGVFWSLAYEVWYYIAFAVFFYLRGAPRVICGAFVLAILGLPALIYFPIWLLGGFIYWLHIRGIEIGPRVAKIGAGTSALCLLALLVTGSFSSANSYVNSALGEWPRHNLSNSMNLPSFYLGGGLTAVHFYFVRYCSLGFLAGASIRKSVVYAASFTFAIYLAHRPLMNIWALLCGHDPKSAASVALLACLVAVSCWCFGTVSEHQKGRWRAFFRWVLSRERQKVASVQ